MILFADSRVYYHRDLFDMDRIFLDNNSYNKTMKEIEEDTVEKSC